MDYKLTIKNKRRFDINMDGSEISESEIFLQILDELKKINDNLEKIQDKLEHGITAYTV